MEKTDSNTVVEMYKRRGTCIVNVRVPEMLVKDIDLWVDSGQFRSRSEFVVTAVRQYLDYMSSRKTVRDLMTTTENDIN